MRKHIASIILLLMISAGYVQAQDLKTSVGRNKELDSLRKQEEAGKDTVIFNSKYIRYTTLKLMRDSVQTIPLDTTLAGIQNFSPIKQPYMPTVGTGVLGLAAAPMLYAPLKNIGFDAGFHSFDFYKLTHDDVKFYRARSPFTSLNYTAASDNEQTLKIIHSQNIKRNWNFGANFNRIGANGFYTHQRGDDLNAAIFTWYQSPNKRYNLLADVIFNTLKAQENGGVVKGDIFAYEGDNLVSKKAEPVKLNTAKQLYRNTNIMIKQDYFVGRIDSTQTRNSQNILPTNKVSYTLIYNTNSYNFKKDEEDEFKVLPATARDLVFTNDTTFVKQLQNEFVYSFFLRSKSSSFIKNELKIDAGIRHNYYSFGQSVLKKDKTSFFDYKTTFQDLTLLGALGYRFSNKIDLNLDVQQIFQGRYAGDFLYEAKSNIDIGNKAGKIIMDAYIQNKSPESIYTFYNSNYYNWDFRKDLDRTKTASFSFRYINGLLGLDTKASYYLISNYTYFVQTAPNVISPAQESGNISLLQINLGKSTNLGSFHFDVYGVYQKTDYANILRTPEFYAFASIYKDQTFFKTLKTQIGFDVRYNSAYVAKSYAPAVAQFYNGDNVVFGSKPIADVWIKAGLRRANLFAKYEYVNQGVFSKGYYTVNQYPMPDRLFKVGVSWNFYD